jgi:hypothetical protein
MEETPDELMQSCRNVLIPPTLSVDPLLGEFRRDGEFPNRKKSQDSARIMPARKNGLRDATPGNDCAAVGQDVARPDG